MVPLEPEAPRAGFSRRAADGEREPCRRALADAVAARRQHVLQRHDVLGLLLADRRQQRREQIPGGGFPCGAHLLQPQARLDVAGGAEVIPHCGPFQANEAALRLSGSRLERKLRVPAKRSVAGPSPSSAAAATTPGKAAVPKTAAPARTTLRRSGKSRPERGF